MKKLNKIISLSVSFALGGASGPALASAFALIEQNASGLGNAYAGQAAAAEDASTIFFNPAGMTRLPGRNFVFAGHLIKPSATFNNSATTPAVSTITGAGPYALNGDGGDGGDLAVIPSAYLSWQLGPQLFAGVGVSVPFGLKTEYDANWMGRFHALKSELKTINVNPSIAYKVNDMVALGAGLNWQRVEAELTKAVNYSFVASAGGIPGVANNTEGSNAIEGDDSTWGFNLGVLLTPSPATNIGLSYRSAMSYKLSGTVAYFGRTPFLNSVLGGAFGAGVGGRCRRADRRRRGYGRSQAAGVVLGGVQAPAQCPMGRAGGCDVDAMEFGEVARHRAQQRGASGEYAVRLPRCLARRSWRELPAQRRMDPACRRRVRPDADFGYLPHAAHPGPGPDLARHRRTVQGVESQRDRFRLRASVRDSMRRSR